MVMLVSSLCMVGYDGPAPGLEIWPAEAAYCKRDIAQASFQHSLKMATKADALGFNWISVSEHHYAPYIMTPNPCVMAGALAQVTRRAKIALLGPLVPLSNPVRLAEELAMVDMLSGGRLVVLFLRGTPNEHQTYDNDPDATRAMTQEGIDLIVKAWTSDEAFAWDGAEYQFSTVSVWPKTVQTPHPPIFGSGNSDESVRFAAARHMGIAFSFAPPEVVQNWVKLYHAEAAKAGWQPGSEHVIYRGIAYAAESDAKAFDDMGAFFGAKMAEQAQIQQKTLGGPPVVPLVLEPYFVGGPETLKGKMEAIRDCGVGVVDLAWGIGAPGQREAAMECFAEGVLGVAQGL
jgi:alkanesulfonate monooxygenase SsuD/methylene tetrahydromethanopterin reductase-like flavin-dependent oxidoreductase (luciferase family)